MQDVHKTAILFLLLTVAFAMDRSLAIGETVSITAGSSLTQVPVGNPGTYTSNITIKDLPPDAKITSVTVEYKFSHCPFDDVILTLSKGKGDAVGLPLFIAEDATVAYIAPSGSVTDNTHFTNSAINDVWSLTMSISHNSCYTPGCNPTYDGHKAHFWYWTLTITYDRAPLTLISPSKYFFTGVNTSVNFQWFPLPNAAKYEVDIFDVNNPSIILYNKTTSATSFNTSSDSTISLQPWRKYGWKVAAVSASGVMGPFSETREFIVGNAECYPFVGTGNGLSSSQSHIDTCYDFSANPGKYRLEDISRRTYMNVDGHNGNMSNSASILTKKYGDIPPLTDADNIWLDQAAGVDAHVNAARVYDYFWKTLQLSSPDGKQNSMISFVGSYDADSCPDNAFFDPYQTLPTVQYCSGSPLSSSLGIVGHEWAHAVTARASTRGTLIYAGESGALNEAFSDWMGISVRRYYYGDNSWVLQIGTKSRDLSNPLNSNPPQPTIYGKEKWVTTYPCTPLKGNDYCGVHTNSGVPNKMFYLLSEPGTRTFNGVTVTGIGIDKAIRIAFRANMERWTNPNLTFRAAMDGMIKAAEGMYGVASIEATQVKNAWAAVGVTEKSTPQLLNAIRVIPTVVNTIMLTE